MLSNKEMKEEKKRNITSNTISPVTKNNKFEHCDIYTLYNELQFSNSRLTTVSWYQKGKVFIDIRPKQEFEKHKIYQFVNIPFNILNNNTEKNNNKLMQIINEIRSYHYQKQIRIIYVILNKNMNENNTYIQSCTYLQAKILFDIYNKMIPIVIIKQDFITFCEKFPFLCYRNNTDRKFEITYPSHILNDELFLGNIDHAINKDIITNLKLTHIINMTMDKNAFEEEKELNIKYLQIPIEDDETAEIEKYFDKGIDFIFNALKQNINGIKNRVLVHCIQGISRSSSLIIAYLIKINQMTYDEAFNWTSHRREIIQPNDGFVKKLKMFEKAYLNKKNSKTNK